MYRLALNGSCWLVIAVMTCQADVCVDSLFSKTLYLLLF